MDKNARLYLIDKYKNEIIVLNNLKAGYSVMKSFIDNGKQYLSNSIKTIENANQIFIKAYEGEGAKEVKERFETHKEHINAEINLLNRMMEDISSIMSDIDRKIVDCNNELDYLITSQ